MAVDSKGRKLPSRRELRLTEKETVYLESPAEGELCSVEASSVEMNSAAEENTSLASDSAAAIDSSTVITAYMPALADYPPRKVTSFAKHMRYKVRTFPAPSLVVSLAVASVVALGTMSLVQVQAATAASKMAASQSILADLDNSTDDIPASLRAKQGAGAAARLQAAITNAQNGKGYCLPKTGASSLTGALLPDSVIYMPMRAGSYQISSPFGVRSDPFTGQSRLHSGQDFAAPMGTPIYAIADGVVLAAGKIPEAGASNVIIIQHEIGGKIFTSWYMHMYDDGIKVTRGDKIKAGEVVAVVGSQGRSTGAHLHLEIHPGAGMDTEAVDPAEFLAKYGAIDIAHSCN